MSSRAGRATLRMRFRSELEAQSKLNCTSIVAKRSLRIVEVLIGGNQVITRVCARFEVCITDLTRGELRMVERVVHFGAKVDQLVLRDRNPFAEREIEVVDAAKRKRGTPTVGVRSLLRQNVAGIRIVRNVGHHSSRAIRKRSDPATDVCITCGVDDGAVARRVPVQV